MKHIQCFFDGSCEPVNPGGTGRWGYAIMEDGVIVHTDYGSLGTKPEMTNNLAEYEGLLQCLWKLEADYFDDLIEIYGDSKMVINMVTGVWGRKKPHKKAPHLLWHLQECRKAFVNLDNCSIQWIPREENQLADFLSKQTDRDDYENQRQG